ncbi:type II secretion system F family protein [Salinarimonas sp.]|uniref:type II secretion system F family protein n=1 Tax=Salinarimonas sp. TaxID=2766526 RepID=UPI00391D4AFF
MTTQQLIVAALAMIAAGGFAWVFLYPIFSGQRRAEARQQALSARPAEKRAERAAANRRDQIAQSLKELEARETLKNKRSLKERIAHAGLDWSIGRFYLVSAGSGVAAGLVGLIATGNLFAAGLAAFAGFFGLPRWTIDHIANRRMLAFVEELPNAIDIIVRGIRAGLPLGDCVREIASSAREPVRTEFRLLVEAQTVGMSLSEAVQRIPERIPTPEANFFAIVIAIQAKAGGNLSEALGNLSRVLRDRKKMKAKVKAMSTEAKTSAAIIASLPFLVVAITYFTSPDYISLNWTTLIGKIVLGVCAFWMMIGVFVMKKMIDFDI